MTRDLDWRRIGDDLATHLHETRQKRGDFARRIGITVNDLEAVFSGQPVHMSVVTLLSKALDDDFSTYATGFGTRKPAFDVPANDPPRQLSTGSFLQHSFSCNDGHQIETDLIVIRHDPYSRRTQFLSMPVHAGNEGTLYDTTQEGFVWHAPEAGATQFVAEMRGLLNVTTVGHPQVRILEPHGRILIVTGTAQRTPHGGGSGYVPWVTPVVLHDVRLPQTIRKKLADADDVITLKQRMESLGTQLRQDIASLVDTDPSVSFAQDTLSALCHKLFPSVDLSVVKRQKGPSPSARSDAHARAK
ncbi:MAG: hypothetical protein R8G34_07790 [Paracoccaceae bacterium]|nr:hypothetical protein [Paracoccaceae bacterium]